MADIQETIADIIAEMRECDGWRAYYDGGLHHDSYDVDVVDVDYLHDFANRIEAAHEREMSKNASKNGADFGQFGNAAKLRGALAALRADIHRPHESGCAVGPAYIGPDTVAENLIDSALAAPPRNCDVGTPEEQAERFTKICTANSKDGVRGLCSETCPFSRDYQGECALAWAQMPYETKEGGAK